MTLAAKRAQVRVERWIAANLSVRVDDLEPGDRVQVRCGQRNGGMTCTVDSVIFGVSLVTVILRTPSGKCLEYHHRSGDLLRRPWDGESLETMCRTLAGRRPLDGVNITRQRVA